MRTVNKITMAAMVLTLAFTLNARAEGRDRDWDDWDHDGDHDRDMEGRSSVSVTPPWADPVFDQNGNPAQNPDTPVYSDNGGKCPHKFPVTAPNGGPIMLSQWRAVTGTAEAECTRQGTRLHISLRHLVPHGVYTVWILGFNDPGVTPDFANLAGVGAIGRPDGSQNKFIASARGEAELSVLQPAGPYSHAAIVPGSTIPKCLFDLGGFQLLGAYHPDGQTHGGHPALDPCDGVSVQFAFNFPPDNRSVRGTGDVVPLFLRTTDPSGAKVPLPTDTAGNIIAPDSALLWESRFGNAVTAPDGHQITWGEYNNVSGRARARCVRDGTRVVIHASGLVPNATYTIWTLVFNGPFPAGPNPSNPLSPNGPSPFGNLVGIGSLGLNDGSENTFHSSASGEGEIAVTMPPGLLSTNPPWLTWQYNVAGCLLNEVEFHLVGVYHFDGKSYGPSPGYAHGAVEHFGIQMKP